MSNERYPESVDFLEEILDQTHAVSGAGAAGLSAWMGNQGQFCTITDECMPTCN